MVDAYTSGGCFQYLMGECFEALDADLARDLLPRYLLSERDQVVHYAAMTVRDREMSELVPALAPSLDALGPGRGCWGPAHALRTLAPGEDSARRILDAGRRVGEAPAVDCFGEIDEAPYRAWLTPDERLHYLITHKLRGLDGGPECLNIDLQHPQLTWEYYWDEDDEAFLREHRERVLDQLRPRLAEEGSPLAALLLGMLRDAAAVDDLRRHFVGAVEFYGWETSYPDELADGQFPRHHAYEQALTAITGLPLAEALPLPDEDRDALLARKDPAALYTLHRLRPEEARIAVLNDFRTRGPRMGRFYGAITIHNAGMLQPGTTASDAADLLGPPDRTEGETWSYETDGLVAPMTMVLVFEDGGLAETRLVEGERYD